MSMTEPALELGVRAPALPTACAIKSVNQIIPRDRSLFLVYSLSRRQARQIVGELLTAF